jgi:hypothetical protein
MYAMRREDFECQFLSLRELVVGTFVIRSEVIASAPTHFDSFATLESASAITHTSKPAFHSTRHNGTNQHKPLPLMAAEMI